MSLFYASAHPASLDSDLLRTFLVVAETKSISAGAVRIGRSQSAVSLQIKRLEEIVGRQLFERHGRGVVATRTGVELLEVAARVVVLLDEGLARLASHDVAGTVRVGIPDEYSPDVLPDVLAAFSRQHPNVEVSVQCASSAGFPGALRRGELDMAVYDVRAPTKGQRILRRQRTVWASSRRHRPETRSPLPVAVFDKACWWHDAAIKALTKCGKAHRIAFESESSAGVIAAIEAGIAVGAIASDAMRDEFRELGRREGLPKLPNSVLVLTARPNMDPSIAQPMYDAIEAAFEKVANA